MGANQIYDYLLNGNIKNSVNFPECSLGYLESKTRLCIFHENKPTLIQQITHLVSSTGANIDNMISKARGAKAYTMLDVGAEVSADTKKSIEKIDGVVRVLSIEK